MRNKISSSNTSTIRNAFRKRGSKYQCWIIVVVPKHNKLQ